MKGKRCYVLSIWKTKFWTTKLWISAVNLDGWKRKTWKIGEIGEQDLVLARKKVLLGTKKGSVCDMRIRSYDHRFNQIFRERGKWSWRRYGLVICSQFWAHCIDPVNPVKITLEYGIQTPQTFLQSDQHSSRKRPRITTAAKIKLSVVSDLGVVSYHCIISNFCVVSDLSVVSLVSCQ